MQEKIKHMKEEDFSELCRNIESVWKEFGTKLGFDNYELEEIENSGKSKSNRHLQISFAF